MRVSIAHEAPIVYIRHIRKHTDFDFAIAHYALEHPTYAKFYQDRPKGRVLIMDNGKFELGAPLPADEVIKAVELTEADYVIAPDHFGNPEKTTKALEDFLELPLPCKVAAVVVGHGPEELAQCYEKYTEIAEIGMYCWSFLYPRADALQLTSLDSSKPHHLLGFGTIREFMDCFSFFAGQGIDVSIDTMKPVSAAAANKTLTDCGRGSYKRPALTDSFEFELLIKNIGIFRGWIDACI